MAEDRDLGERGLENQVEGTAKDLKGRVKDAAGGLLGDSSLQGEGKLDRMEGKLQEKLGEVQSDVDRGLDKLDRDRDENL